jgi:hypothetical protein
MQVPSSLFGSDHLKETWEFQSTNYGCSETSVRYHKPDDTERADIEVTL